MLNNTLANTLSAILNAERRGKKELVINPGSSLIKKVLTILNAHGYIGSFEEIETAQGGWLKVHLIGSINRVNVITPRFAVKVKDLIKFEKRFLPASDVGIIIVSTPKGIITHTEAKKVNAGGKLLAYCY